MKRIFLIIVFLSIHSPSFASVLEGTYTSLADNGTWTMYLNDSGSEGTLYMLSARYFFIRYGTGTYNSVTGEISVPSMSSPLGDTSSMTANLTGSSVTGVWQSSTFGRGTLTGDNRALDFYSGFKGYRNLQVNDPQGAFMTLIQFSDEGKATLYDRYGATIGNGFINSNGTIGVAVSGTDVTLVGTIANGALTGGYWAYYQTGSTQWPTVTEVTCNVIPNYVQMNQSTFPRVGERVTFNTSTISECPNTSSYYQYFYCPDYGSASYDPNLWVSMNSFSTESSLTYAFDSAGYYVVVVWTSAKPVHQNPATQGGFTILVKN
ncbi:hypothetical protein [Desulforegula conservatrix]|uniref:hypothetical protein n=1 Tax=Desulforegula conservatrix TaxID=153026 RepID=UPI00041F1830|nr:hypothetical protein [Desulforegula conservatrix]